MREGISTAFVLGAGLGTRLRPLTDLRPKPLVPIFNKPLITFAFDHLMAAGASRFVVNTHHRPEAYSRWLGEIEGRAEYLGCPVFFRHEPVLLETGGGIKNAADLIGDSPFIIYNGDVLADFPLTPLIEAHMRSDNIATLALRSSGVEKRIQRDPETGLVSDMRGLLGGCTDPSFLFTGVSIFSPEIFRHIPAGEIISIIPILAELMRHGAKVGGEIIDEGVWFDIGNLPSYLGIHRTLASHGHSFSYLDPDWNKLPWNQAIIHPSATINGCSALAPGAEVGPDAVLENVVVWPDAKVDAGVYLRDAVVTPQGVCQCNCESGPDGA